MSPKPTELDEAQDNLTRLILYVGKGGVGKTTCAAATAVRSAELGKRTLVVSTDIAHSLGDVFDREIGDTPRELADNLFVQEISVLEETRRLWGRFQGEVARALEREGLPSVQADELAVIPGMQEVVALIRIFHEIRAGSYDCLIVDAAPTGETLRLLAMPDSLEWYASRFMQWRSRLNRLAGPLIRGFLPDLEIVDIIQDLSGRLRELRTALTDATRSSYRLVLTPDQAVLKEAQRAETYLNLFEYPIDALVINRVFPADVAGNEYLRVLKDRQEHMLAAVNMSFPTLPAFSAPLMAREPVGLQALSAFATEVFGDTDPSAILHLGATQTYEETPHGVMLRIPMPNVELSKLSLTKRGDELYVEVGAFRRLIPLPVSVAALKPQAAKMRSGFLEIPFVSAAGET